MFKGFPQLHSLYQIILSLLGSIGTLKSFNQSSIKQIVIINFWIVFVFAQIFESIFKSYHKIAFYGEIKLIILTLILCDSKLNQFFSQISLQQLISDFIEKQSKDDLNAYYIQTYNTYYDKTKSGINTILTKIKTWNNSEVEVSGLTKMNKYFQQIYNKLRPHKKEPVDSAQILQAESSHLVEGFEEEYNNTGIESQIMENTSQYDIPEVQLLQDDQ